LLLPLLLKTLSRLKISFYPFLHPVHHQVDSSTNKDEHNGQFSSYLITPAGVRVNITSKFFYITLDFKPEPS
jgi:hypothetical protein